MKKRILAFAMVLSMSFCTVAPTIPVYAHSISKTTDEPSEPLPVAIIGISSFLLAGLLAYKRK